MAKLTQERLHNLLSYNPETGIFAWQERTSPRVSIGDRAGVIAKNGRRYITIDGDKFMAHRLAWFYVNGEWPESDLRQKNNDFDDCRWDNLEEVSRSVASRNRALDGRNKSGYRGVSQTKSGRWTAFITREYKQLCLGVFDTPEEASAAFELAASELESSVTLDQKTDAAEKSAIRRRLRVAWDKLNKAEPEHFFVDYEEFVATVKDVPARHSVVSCDDFGPVGPGNFDFVPDLSTGFDLSTREGRIAYNRAHRQANPDVYRDRELRKSFGIGLDDYNRMLKEQNGVCAICKKPETLVNHGRVMPLPVDHCHKTGKIRGLLCAHCNHAIGKFDDDVALLESAISYLKCHAQPNDWDKATADAVKRSPHRDWLIVATPNFEGPNA